MTALVLSLASTILVVFARTRLRRSQLVLQEIRRPARMRQTRLARLVHLLLLSDWRRTRRERRDIESTTFFAVNLFVVALGNGCNVPGAVESVGRYCPGALGRELDRAARRMRSGLGVIESLELLRDGLPRSTRPFVSILLAGERYGSPLSEVLERLADQCRTEQRRQAERSAKRLSVQLLFPLAVFTLPAFALLTLAPIIASALGVLASNSG